MRELEGKCPNSLLKHLLMLYDQLLSILGVFIYYFFLSNQAFDCLEIGTEEKIYTFIWYCLPIVHVPASIESYNTANPITSTFTKFIR